MLLGIADSKASRLRASARAAGTHCGLYGNQHLKSFGRHEHAVGVVWL